jgi:predicted metal-dependent hydrolase
LRKIVSVEGVGDVLFERSSRAKYINISVRHSGKVRVAVPYRTSYRKAVAFARTKVDWINKQLSRLEQIEKKIPLEKVDKAEARRVLIPRLQYLAEKHGYKYNRVALRNQKTRWGSCSARNNINLVSLPQDLMDYVILHELTHTKVKNHSKDFWKQLAKHIPNAKEQNKELRNYSIHLGR